MGRSNASRKRPVEEEQGGTSVRAHVIVVAPGEVSFDCDLWTNARIDFGAADSPQRGASTKLHLRVVPGHSANCVDSGDAGGNMRDDRTSTPAGQLPLPEAPGPVAPRPEEAANALRVTTGSWVPPIT